MSKREQFVLHFPPPLSSQGYRCQRILFSVTADFHFAYFLPLIDDRILRQVAVKIEFSNQHFSNVYLVNARYARGNLNSEESRVNGKKRPVFSSEACYKIRLLCALFVKPSKLQLIAKRRQS